MNASRPEIQIQLGQCPLINLRFYATMIRSRELESLAEWSGRSLNQKCNLSRVEKHSLRLDGQRREYTSGEFRYREAACDSDTTRNYDFRRAHSYIICICLNIGN